MQHKPKLYQTSIMQKVITILFVGSVLTLASCESKPKTEAATGDSTAAMAADSAAMTVDSAATATVDSAAASTSAVAPADSIK